MACCVLWYASEGVQATTRSGELHANVCPGFAMKYIRETSESPSVIEYWKNDSEQKLLAIITTKIVNGRTVAVYKLLRSGTLTESAVTTITSNEEILKFLNLQVELMNILEAELKLPSHTIGACEAAFYDAVNK